MKRGRDSRIYLDNAAATPLNERVEKAMKSYFGSFFANPSAIYKEGVAVKKKVLEAHGSVAGVLGVHSDEIIFTGSGTEANNLAILGVIKSYKGKTKPHIITTVIEHPSVLNVCKYIEEKEMARVTYIGVNSEGLVDPKEIKKALNKNTILVSVIYANNEIGTIQPIKEIAKTIRHFKKVVSGGLSVVSQHGKVTTPLFHVDACQAVNYLNINVNQLGVDLMTFNSSKIYGPKGVGVLYKKRGIVLEPIVRGGGQEEGLRSGTENVPAIVGMAEALKITEKMKEKELVRLTKLRDYFIKNVLEKVPGVKLNGGLGISGERLPNNINFSFPDIESQLMVIELDARGVAASAKSACASDDDESSYVVHALGGDKGLGYTSVRFSLGRQTTKSDIDKTIKAVMEICSKYSKI